MKHIDYFNRKIWLADLRLKQGEVVCVDGRPYRYNVEKARPGAEEHTLTPTEGSCQ